MKLSRQKLYSDDNGVKGAAIITGVGGGLSYLGYRGAVNAAKADTGLNAVGEQIENLKNPELRKTSKGVVKSTGVTSSTTAATSEVGLFNQGKKAGTLKNTLGIDTRKMNQMRNKNSKLIADLSSGKVNVSSAEASMKNSTKYLKGVAMKKALLPGLAVTGLLGAGYLGYKQLTKNKNN